MGADQLQASETNTLDFGLSLATATHPRGHHPHPTPIPLTKPSDHQDMLQTQPPALDNPDNRMQYAQRAPGLGVDQNCGPHNWEGTEQSSVMMQPDMSVNFVSQPIDFKGKGNGLVEKARADHDGPEKKNESLANDAKEQANAQGQRQQRDDQIFDRRDEEEVKDNKLEE